MNSIDRAHSPKFEEAGFSSFGPPSLASNKDKPSFEVEPVQLQFALNNNLQRLTVQNNHMVLVVENILYKIDLNNPSKVQKHLVPGAPAIVTNIWQHHNGKHLLIQVNQNNYYYLHDTYKQLKALPKLKNLNIQFIAFANASTDDSTGDFLIGASDSSIYIASIKSHDPTTQENKRDDKYLKLAFKTTTEQEIRGLTFSQNFTQVNMITSSSAYSWEFFDTSYSELSKVFKSVNPKVVSLPKSEKSLFVTNNSQFVYLSLPQNTIYAKDDELELSQSKDLSIDNDNLSADGSMLLSPHHIFILNKERNALLIYNKLSLQLPPMRLSLDDYLLDNNSLKGMTFDYISKTYWLFTKNSIFELIIHNESISVWYNYYKLGKYEEALKCISDSESQSYFHKKNTILIKQGYKTLQEGGFGVDFIFPENSELSINESIRLQERGIKILAESSEPFQKICLMLLNMQPTTNHTFISSKDSIIAKNSSTLLTLISQKLLIDYLESKFEIAKNHDRNKIRVTILSSWLVELMLRTLYRLEYDIDESSSKDSVGNQKSDSNLVKISILNQINKNLNEFLNKNFKLLDSETLYQIMKELSYSEKFLYYAELIEDFEFILRYHIDTENWKDALRALTKLYGTGKAESKTIIYSFAPTLLLNAPKITVETWLKFADIKYENFLPAILIYNKKNTDLTFNENYTLQFLSKVIYDKGVRSKQINNYYLSLLISFPGSKSSSTKQTIKFLNHMKHEKQTRVSRKGSPYDSNFILRLCLSHKQYHPAVLILLNDMSLFEQALKLAIDHDLNDLAVFVLRKYDEFIANGIESRASDKNSRSVSLPFSGGKDIEQDIEHVSKVDLEEKNYSSRKHLWIMYSKYLIMRVCDGEIFEFLSDIEVGSNKQKLPYPESKSHSLNIETVTNDIASSMLQDYQIKHDKSPDSEIFNKVLRYILRLSSLNSDIGVLGLNDLLPLFPESIMISKFKDEIVKSLNQYNNKINQLSLEMQESLVISSNLKQRIKDFNKEPFKSKTHSIIQPGEPCQVCEELLISKNFVYFPNCHHGHHKDCLIRLFLKSKGNYNFKKIFSNFNRNPSALNRNELDGILIKECYFCNDGNIDSIDQTLIDIDESISWAL